MVSPHSLCFHFCLAPIPSPFRPIIQPRSQGLFPGLGVGRESGFKQNDGKLKRLKVDPSQIARTFSPPSWFWHFWLCWLANLLHPGFQGVRATRDQPMPGSFPVPPPSQGRKDPGNEVAHYSLAPFSWPPFHFASIFLRSLLSLHNLAPIPSAHPCAVSFFPFLFGLQFERSYLSSCIPAICTGFCSRPWGHNLQEA